MLRIAIELAKKLWLNILVDNFLERTYNACMDREDFNQYLNGEFKVEEVKLEEVFSGVGNDIEL